MRIFFTASPPQLPCGNPVRQRHAYNLGGRQADGGCARFAPSSRPSRLPSPGTLTGGRRFRCFAHRQRPPELLDQRLAVEAPFLDKAKHTLLQHTAIGGRQGLGGDHDDRDFLVRRVALERVEEGKTVHARHDQVEQNHVWPHLREVLEAGDAVGGPVNGEVFAFAQLADQLWHVRIVIDHKDPPALRGDTSYGADQGLAVERLDEVVSGAEPKTKIRPIDDREQDDRNIAGYRVALEGVQHLPAIDVRHYDVESYGAGIELARLLEPLFPAFGADHAVTRVGEVLPEQVEHIAVVVDGEHDFLPGTDGRLGGGRRARRRRRLELRCASEPYGESDRERGTFPEFALNGDVAAQ